MSRPGTAAARTALRTGLLHEAFGHFIRRAHLRSQQAFAKAFDGSDLSPLQYGILELVLLNPGITHGELAEGLATAPSVVTTAMKSLRDDGFLVKHPAADDGRRCGYSLSHEGEAFFTAVRAHILEAEQTLLEPLDEDERQALMHLLQQLTANGKP